MTTGNAVEILAGEVPTRDQIALEDTWDLSGIYPEESAWEGDADRMSALVATTVNHRGALGESAARLRQALDDIMTLRQTLERIRVYAVLRRDENLANSEALARYERSVALAIEAGEALAFVEPELLSLPPQRLDELRADPALAPYQHMLDDLARRRPHVRSAEIEQILAQGADVARAPSDAFTALDNADLTFGRVRDETGKEIELTKARHALLLALERPGDASPCLRDVHEGLSRSPAHAGGSARRLGARRRVSGPGTKLPLGPRRGVVRGQCPAAVYDTLIASDSSGAAGSGAVPGASRRRARSRRARGVRPPGSIVPDPEQRHAYREASNSYSAVVGLLGEDYVDDLRTGFARRWVDVHETREAFRRVLVRRLCRATRHPDELERHAERRVTRSRTRPAMPCTATTPTPTSPSTRPATRSSSPRSPQPSTRCFLPGVCSSDRRGQRPGPGSRSLDRFAEGYFGTVVRQTMFAEYEQRVHALAEAGTPLTRRRPERDLRRAL